MSSFSGLVPFNIAWGKHGRYYIYHMYMTYYFFCQYDYLFPGKIVQKNTNPTGLGLSSPYVLVVITSQEINLSFGSATMWTHLACTVFLQMPLTLKVSNRAHLNSLVVNIRPLVCDRSKLPSSASCTAAVSTGSDASI